MKINLSLIILCCVSIYTTSCFANQFAPVSFEETEEIATEAYIYAYPLVLMEITRRIWTNVETPNGVRGPMNQFSHSKYLIDDKYTDIVGVDASTMFSSFWYDVSNEPLYVELPDSKGRYYVLELIDMWTDIFSILGTRTMGNHPQSYVLANSSWKGTIPEGAILIKSPTNIGMLIISMDFRGLTDYPEAWKFQKQLKTVPLSSYNRQHKFPINKVNTNIDMSNPSAQIAKMTGLEFFQVFYEATKHNAPHHNDYPILHRMSRIGLIPGKKFIPTEPAIIKAIQDAPLKAGALAAGHKLAVHQNQWFTTYYGIGTYGTYYLQRALVAHWAITSLTNEEVMYSAVIKDQTGNFLDSSKTYVMRFAKGQTPPVHGFWTVSLFNDKRLLAKNAFNRHSINSHTKLKYNSDGSVDILVKIVRTIGCLRQHMVVSH